MSKREQAFQDMYNVLLRAIDTNSDSPLPVATAEVLGYTGDWLSQLDNYQLSLLIEQVNAQLKYNLENE